MRTQKIDLRKITKENENKWIALSQDYKKIIGTSEKLIDLKKQIGSRKVVYMKTPISGSFYAF